MRIPRLSSGVLVVLVMSGALAGCAGGSDAVDVQPGAGPSPSAATDLRLSVDDGTGTVNRSRLTCDPPGGDHPDPEAACAALESHGATALPAVPSDQMCTLVYGGAQSAELTGTWRGTPVEASFSRGNGCEIARWDALDGLLPPAAGS